ncbi:general transcription factor II-I repeat domain-containing protein 2-like [Watersipora subatra]|uniref:general transcription factor II-I repeat domain-containing protein 2-like n=1 Tax=Watersipora subatra TaxID=2589382 RepID=UPI00355C5818
MSRRKQQPLKLGDYILPTLKKKPVNRKTSVKNAPDKPKKTMYNSIKEKRAEGAKLRRHEMKMCILPWAQGAICISFTPHNSQTSRRYGLRHSISIKVELGDIECYSLAFDESTDIRDTAQLAVFIRAVDKDFNVTEELLDLNSLNATARGVDIFEGVQASLQKMGIEDFSKCVSLCTDGAASMIGCRNGLIARVRELQQDVIAVHCIIHQENLSAKIINMDHVNSVVVKTINYICSRGLNHREFQEFLRNLDSQSEHVVYFTEVRWLSRASTLQRFWLLLDEIILFLKLIRKEAQELCDPLWQMDFAFLNGISQKLSQLNVRLQGQNKLVHDLFKHLRTFERDLQLYEQSLREEKVDHFPTLRSVFNGNNEILDSYAQRVAVLREEISSRFTEFRSFRSEMTIFSLPCTCEISSAAIQFQLELNGAAGG